MKSRFIFAATVVLLLRATVRADPPVPTDDRLTMQLIAREPEIVTPTGIAVDARGRVWVVENNTHMTPKNYAGHPTDRILVMDDFAPDGKARKISVFAEGLKNTMSLAVRPDGAVYVVCRNGISILRDTKDAGTCDERKQIVTLDTRATYPHNGLNGITFSPDGKQFYFCLGLNTGFPYKVIGSDGSTQSGGGEGGSMYRCNLDGSHVERVATGFWNVHDLTFDPVGRLFAVDNDPDDRPPCRLLDIIEGGDYGWKFSNGRKGIHPFTSWNGELPGTLPMISSVGEAPCGIVAYESNGLPDDYRGDLLVTSWGDHVIQRFKLQPKGASFTSYPEPIVRGGTDFRPVGIAIAPDGSLVVSDWVDKSYPVHGHGRVWRIRMKRPAKEVEARSSGAPPRSPAELLRLNLLSCPNVVEALQTLSSIDTRDPFLASAAIYAWSRSDQMRSELNGGVDARGWNVIQVLAARRSGNPRAKEIIPTLLKSKDVAVRRAALQWVGEERLSAYADLIPGTLTTQPVTRDILMFALAASAKLSKDPPAEGKAPDERPGGEMAFDVLFDEKQEPMLRRLALQLVDPRSKRLDAGKLQALIGAAGVDAVRALAWRGDEPSQAVLRQVAADASGDTALRREAVAGLAPSAATSPESKRLLLDLADNGEPELRAEALRSLRGQLDRAQGAQLMADLRRALDKPDLGTADDRREWAEQMLLAFKATPDALSDADRKDLEKLASDRPRTEAAWQAALAEGGDPDAGRRVFYHANAARCFVCHTIDNRGGKVGPDLSHVSAAMDRKKIVESILDPSREIAPLYVPVVITLKNGDVVTGIAGLEDVGSDKIQVRDATGKATVVRVDDIASQRQEKLSIMPNGLPDALTVREFRDLVAFLSQQK